MLKKLKELREHFIITWISKYYNLNRDYEELNKKYQLLQRDYYHLIDMVDIEFWEEVDNNESLCSSI